jgi:hypothetical protein
MPTERMGPPPGASPPMRMTASWSGPNLPNTSLRRAIRAQWRAPLRSSRRRIAGPSDAELSKKGPSPAHRPSACSGVKALRNTSLAKAASRQAPLAFRSLDPFRALREPDCRRRDEKRPFPLRTKNCQHNPNNRLTGKAPYKFESGFLQERVHCELHHRRRDRPALLGQRSDKNLYDLTGSSASRCRRRSAG